MHKLTICGAFLFVLFGSLGLGQDEKGRALYLAAKSAYDDERGSGCSKAVGLLKEYLTTFKPASEMTSKISNAIYWCEFFCRNKNAMKKKKHSKVTGGADRYRWVRA